MKMFTATRVAALAVGLSLAGTQAFAAPDGGRRGHDKDNTATQQQDQNDRGDRNHKRRPQSAPAEATPATPTPTVTPAVQGQPQFRQDRNAKRLNDQRGRNVQGVDRRNDNNGKWQNNDRRRNFGTNDRRRDGGKWQNNDRRRDGGQWQNNQPRRDFGNNNDRRNWDRQDRRRTVDVSRYHRNFNAPRRYHAGRYHEPRGYSYRRYSYGQHLPRHYFGRNFWLANFIVYGLFSPPPGYVWVRYGPDALLIDEETGEIVQIQYNMFYS